MNHNPTPYHCALNINIATLVANILMKEGFIKKRKNKKAFILALMDKNPICTEYALTPCSMKFRNNHGRFYITDDFGTPIGKPNLELANIHKQHCHEYAENPAVAA